MLDALQSMSLYDIVSLRKNILCNVLMYPNESIKYTVSVPLTFA